MELKELLRRCVRVVHIARKPTSKEYSKVARVTALGIFAFGFIGFIISIIFGLI